MGWEARVNEIIVRAVPDKAELEITQDHIEEHGNGGVFIAVDQVDQLKALLDQAAEKIIE